MSRHIAKEQCMASNQAIVVDHAVSGKLAVRTVAMPTPARAEAVVRVAAISLNRGETRRAMQSADGWQPGWDLAGVVERAAADGSGPPPGTRVVGLLPVGAWAEYVAVPTNALAALPGVVTFAQAATPASSAGSRRIPIRARIFVSKSGRPCSTVDTY